MAFAANPLSLSVTDAAFESWLRDNGYLEVLDDRATAAGAASPSPSSSSASPLPDLLRPRANADDSLSAFPYAFSSLRSFASLFTLNPFAKLTAEDLTRSTPSWTLEFIGSGDSYSWPAGPSQARMRVQENVRRYARNYAVLSLLVFACSLYKMPVALLGLLACLFLWELVRFCSGRWHLEERSPGLRQVLIYAAQLATAMVLYMCNLQLAIACAVGVSYAAMIFHAFLRKLTPRSIGGGNQHKRLLLKK
ncbi:PRA1 family protein H-like [Zingiber officinale]|uniref:PRA1 family protein H-like n=1 Tax=Zingiber officinale TaxID=94328 RepID=UPI001C4BE4DA|nr:PRA1 family protein H-like [Zingiber officinale]